MRHAWLLLILLSLPAVAAEPSAIDSSEHTPEHRSANSTGLHSVEIAVAEAEAAVARAPDRPEPLLVLAEAHRARIPHSSRYRQLLIAHRIKDTLEAAVAREGRPGEAHLALLRFHLRAPVLAGGSTSEARRLHVRIAAVGASHDRLARGLIDREHGRLAAAIGHFRSALADLDHDPALRRLAQRWLGTSLIEAGEHRQAAELYTAAVAADPEFADAWFGLGLIASETGERLDQGVTALHRYLRFPPRPGRPGPEQAHFRLGLIYGHMAFAEQARNQLQLALALDPDLDEAHQALDRL